MRLHIATHDKIFHADEVTAVALLRVFTKDEIVVSRVPHNIKDFSSYDMVIDIGREFDGKKYFDHHQNRGGKSSAGLIWDYLNLGENYSKISKLIKLVDDNDVGIAKAKPFEYSNLIKCFNNSEDIYGSVQDKQFEKAVLFAMTVLDSMKNMQNSVAEAKTIVTSSFTFDNNPAILELSRFNPHWSTYINGETMPNIKAVVWEDEHDKSWKVQIPPKRVGSFELQAEALKQDSSMEFVHSSGYFAVAKSEEIMKKFLAKMLNNTIREK